MRNLHTLCVLLLLSAVGLGAQTQDEVKFTVNGYTHKWYSGYLNFSMGQFHYILFDSQTDPANDPLVLWLNGGPGCSSLIGMIYENGPFTVIPNTTFTELNNYTWNMHANVLYLESPGGVGYSMGFRNNSNNDTTVAQDNYRALVDFFRKFPNLKKNDFYISGQSYAGIYIPYLAMEILRNNVLPERQLTMLLKGILVGNACTDPRECYEPTYGGSGDSMSIYQYEFLHAHGYITDNRYDQIRANCILGYGGEGCEEVRKLADKAFAGTKTQINNIYAPCFNQAIPNLPRKYLQSSLKRTMLQDAPGDDTTTCEDLMGIQAFFNEPTMFVHLHVPPMHYMFCSDDVANGYQMNPNASEWIYPLLIKQGLRVWVYSGDVDANVPITGTINWVTRMKENEGFPVEQPWREWWVPGKHKHEDQVGGMVWQLRGFTFVSVKGAGHMVPSDKRVASLTMLTSFLAGAQLPYKTP